MDNIDLNKASVQDIFLGLNLMHLVEKLQLSVEETEIVNQLVKVKAEVLNYVPERLQNNFDDLVPKLLESFSKKNMMDKLYQNL